MAMLPKYDGRTADLPHNVGLRPYHPRGCRTDTKAIVEKLSGAATMGAKVGADDREVLERFTPQEHLLRAEQIRKRAQREGLVWKPELAAEHYKKHGGKGQFNETQEEYLARAQRTVKNADRVLGNVERGKRADSVARTQYVYIHEATKTVTVVDDDGQIRTCYPIGGEATDGEAAVARYRRGVGGGMLWLDR